MFRSLDTETTGLDPHHGSKPFLVTMCDENKENIWWEWDVDPYTREPEPGLEDLIEIDQIIQSAVEGDEDSSGLVLAHAKFDFTMLDVLDYNWSPWPWDRIHDVQFSAHLLASCQKKDLETLALIDLGINLKPYELRVEEAVKKVHRIIRTKPFIEEFGEWARAKAGRSDMPSCGGRAWKADMWILRALVKHAPHFLPDWKRLVDGEWEYWEHGDSIEDHPFNFLCSDYANPDAEVTLPIFQKHKKMLQTDGLWPLYKERQKLNRIVYDMQNTGVTYSMVRKEELTVEYEKECEKLHQKCLKIADHENLHKLPVNGVSNALREVVFDKFGLVTHKNTKKGNPSMDKTVLEKWMEDLNPRSKQYHFINGLRQYRQRMTALGYMKSYNKFSVVIKGFEDSEFRRLHPSLNPTGPNTLRWSSSNPNEQNISKKEGFNLRYCFGPTPGRAWASLDYENIELRIPAYESGEKELIDLFERPDDPPYYGSNHLLNFSAVYEDLWEVALDVAGHTGAAKYVKTKWKSTWYQRCKNGDFAVQYGAVEKEDGWGTADKAFDRQWSHRKLKERFGNLEELNQACIDEANETGYVHTMPDLEISPDKGYPIECSRTNYGRISPTVPLNYHVQSTACWVIMRAMIKVEKYLDRLNEGKCEEDKWHMILQVHDELVIDFPKKGPWQFHLKKIKKIMESVGEAIQVPLRVGCEIHEKHWAESYDLAV